MTLHEMGKKEVISIKDCRRLGRVVDLEFDECKGCIGSIIVAPKNNLFNCLFNSDEICIPFCNIRQIGPDIILVDYHC